MGVFRYVDLPGVVAVRQVEQFGQEINGIDFYPEDFFEVVLGHHRLGSWRSPLLIVESTEWFRRN